MTCAKRFCLSQCHYVQMRVLFFIFVFEMFLFYWFKQSIYCRINNPELLIAMFSEPTIPIRELKISFNKFIEFTCLFLFSIFTCRVFHQSDPNLKDRMTMCKLTWLLLILVAYGVFFSFIFFVTTGVLVSTVISSETQRAFLLVLDAKTLDEIARANIPETMSCPITFHGGFFHW